MTPRDRVPGKLVDRTVEFDEQPLSVDERRNDRIYFSDPASNPWDEKSPRGEAVAREQPSWMGFPICVTRFPRLRGRLRSLWRGDQMVVLEADIVHYRNGRKRRNPRDRAPGKFSITVQCAEPGCDASFTVEAGADGDLLASDGMFTVDTGWLAIPDDWTAYRVDYGEFRFVCSEHDR